MSFKLNVRIDKGIMPRHGILNKPLNLILDDEIIAGIDWGEKRSFNVPAGNHTLTLKPKRVGTSNTLQITAKDGETVEIRSFLDTKIGGLHLINLADYKPNEDLRNIQRQIHTANKESAEYPVRRQQQESASDQTIVGFFAFAGAAAFFIVNILTGLLPGGFIGGAIGGGIGAVLGMVINAIRRKIVR